MMSHDSTRYGMVHASLMRGMRCMDRSISNLDTTAEHTSLPLVVVLVSYETAFTNNRQQQSSHSSVSSLFQPPFQLHQKSTLMERALLSLSSKKDFIIIMKKNH